MADPMKRCAALLFVALAGGGSPACAQTATPVRALGRVLNTSVEPLGSVSQVRALPGGRVIVHDLTARRVLLFDSTLALVSVIVDTTSATSNAYGSQYGGLIAYRGDSTLFVTPGSLSMFVIDAGGRIVRTMAGPRAADIGYLAGGPFGTPGFDAKGRLIYGSAIRLPSDPVTRLPAFADSSLILRLDLPTRVLDTAAKYGVPVVHRGRTETEVKGKRVFMSFSVVNPIPWTDDWAMLADGTIAIVRGREYRVDFIDASGTMRSAPKVPFDWQRLGDADKQAIVDSTKADFDKHLAAIAEIDSARNAARGMLSPAQPTPPPPEIHFVPLDEIPAYRPAFRQGAARGDADGRLWVRTTEIVNGGAVYDVIDLTGALVDRILVPPGRVIAGFGPGGVVYMGVVDGNITRLERARVR
jgi:hypothetical protein